MQTNINSQTGSYIALAGIIVALLQRWDIIVDENAIVTVLAALAIIYGWIHQFIVTRKIKKAAIGAGVKGIR